MTGSSFLRYGTRRLRTGFVTAVGGPRDRAAPRGDVYSAEQIKRETACSRPSRPIARGTLDQSGQPPSPAWAAFQMA